MHELSLTEKMFHLVLKEAEAHRAKQINKISFAIGELSGIVEDSVEFYFQLISKGTIAEQAQLKFKRIPARLFCIQCNQEFQKSQPDFLCPSCGNLARLTEIGQECIVESIEVD